MALECSCLHAGVSRSFTYENSAANSMIAEAQTRTEARNEGRIEGRTAQEESSWRERALNAEDQIRTSAASLLPSVSSSATCSDSYESRMAPGSNTIGTGFAGRTSTFSPSGTCFCVKEMNFSGDWTAHERTSPASRNNACRSCSPMAREEGGSHLIGNEGRINLPDLAKQARIVARRAPGRGYNQLAL